MGFSIGGGAKAFSCLIDIPSGEWPRNGLPSASQPYVWGSQAVAWKSLSFKLAAGRCDGNTAEWIHPTSITTQCMLGGTRDSLNEK